MNMTIRPTIAAQEQTFFAHQTQTEDDSESGRSSVVHEPHTLEDL